MTTRYPKCERHKLLRTCGKHSTKQIVVSSTALYAKLGNQRYQEFIRWNEGKRQTNYQAPGFHPDTVETFLNA